MKRTFLLACTLVISGFLQNASAAGFEVLDDPYLLITQERLPNGIQVVMAPNDKAKTFRMKVRVRAGFASENEARSGISHLLEHYLFTDARLKDDMSYVEMIREKGGSANGQTEEMQTVYFATVPASEAAWLSSLFYGMLFHRTFEADRLEQVKKPVLLEIGKPEPLAALLDTFLKVATPSFLRQPDFWESEFGIHHERALHPHESLNTVRLSAKEVEAYYREYYHPGNVTLFLAGKFDPIAARKQLSESFGTVQEWPGKILVEDAPKPRNAAYVRSSSTAGTPFISLGTKIQDLTPADEISLRIYLEYLAHRLVKEIRNKHGDTYGVRHVVDLRENFGDGTITMEAPAERYRQYLDYTRSLIQSEARDGELTEAQFKEATDLYSAHFKLSDRDSGTQLGLAENFERWSRVYGKKVSEFDAFHALTYPEFRERLQNLFRKGHEISLLREPPVFGRMEYFFLNLAIIVAFLLLARRVFASKFDHAKVRWMRKLSNPPAYLAETAFLLWGLLLASYAQRGVDLILLKSDLIQSTFLLSEYFSSVLSWGISISACILCCSFLLRKAIVSGDTLYLKSMTYTSRRIQLADIESISAMSVFRVLTSPKTVWAVKWRFQFWNPFLWQKGTLIRLKGGKAFFVGIRKSELAAKELAELISAVRPQLLQQAA